MRKVIMLLATVVCTMGAMSITVSADEGVVDTINEVVFETIPEETSYDEPSQEDPHVEEPVNEAPVEEAHNNEPEVAQSTNDNKEEVVVSSNNESVDNTDNTSSDNTPSEEVTAPVIITETTNVATSDAPAAPSVVKTSTKKEKVTKNVSTKKKISLAQNKVSVVPEDLFVPESIVVHEEAEMETKPSLLSVIMMLLLVAFLCAAAFYLITGRKYVVVRRYEKDGKMLTEEVMRFFSIDRACEYLRDYQWCTEDEVYTALNILNISRNDVEDNAETGVNNQLVYVVSADKEVQQIIYANEFEIDAIGRILGYVQENVAELA